MGLWTTCRQRLWRFAPVVATLFFSGGSLAGQDCYQQLFESASPYDDLKLCRAELEGESGLFSCREFQDGEGSYVVAFKGGPVPQAIYYRVDDPKAPEMRLLWTKENGGMPTYCRLPPPRLLPEDAKHLGTGVCTGDDGRKRPCSLYRHAGTRHYEVSRYFVFYHREGWGPVHVQRESAGIHHDAFVAELAFQIASQLLQTDCCRERGEAYLRHAQQLFPTSDLYRGPSVDDAEQFVLSEQGEPEIRDN